ncbi:MAG: DNA polymerase I [Candidatus Saccharimonadales bacterium]
MAELHKKLAIIDGKSVFYRGYYAMPNLSMKDGTPTGGVFGFATMALEVIRRLKPDYVCVAWDKPKTNIRKRLELYPEYKAGRKPAPPDFYAQIPLLHDLLKAFGWPLYELDDYEADDIMGTLAIQATAKKIDTMLITSDLDMLQLVNPFVHVYALKKGLSNIELYNPKSFEAKYGIRVDQFLDLKALKGDSSDNIPGVPGIGEKTAIELLIKHGTLDEIYENLDLLKESTRKKLVAGKELAYLSKQLGSIWIDAPLKLDEGSLDGSSANPTEIYHLLQKYEFRSLVRQLPEVMQVPIDASGTTATPLATGKTIMISNKKDLLSLNFKDNETVILQSRCSGKHGRDPALLLIGTQEHSTYAIDIPSLDSHDIKMTIGRMLKNKKIEKIGYDIKSTIKACMSLDMPIENITHDVFIGAFILNSLRREKTITEMAQVDLEYDGPSFEEMPTNEFAERASLYIEIVRALYTQQIHDLKAIPSLLKLVETIEWPVIAVLARMEYEGIQLDTEYLRFMAMTLKENVSDLEQQIYGYADFEFNISSPSQLADVLFNSLNLSRTGIKKGKTGLSTAASELDKLRGSHPIIDLLSQYREMTKLQNTYVDTLPKLIDSHSRIHTTFNLTIAQTGRLSSTDPNLQNIPVRTELGKQIRTAFVAGEKKRLVSADYSQFELRLAAYLANDVELIAMFNNGIDVHTMTAAQVYGREPEDVTKNMRRDAKVINFGVLYGMSPHGLSIATGMTQSAAKLFIDKYFELRKPLLDYMTTLKEKARQEGYVETLFGRRRPTPDIHSSNFIVRQAAERAAINMPIQGTEADLMKMAMVKFDQEIRGSTCKQLLQIHDSILVECPEEEAESIAQLLKTVMESVYPLPVLLPVETSIGRNWGEL